MTLFPYRFKYSSDPVPVPFKATLGHFLSSICVHPTPIPAYRTEAIVRFVVWSLWSVFGLFWWILTDTVYSCKRFLVPMDVSLLAWLMFDRLIPSPAILPCPETHPAEHPSFPPIVHVEIRCLLLVFPSLLV